MYIIRGMRNRQVFGSLFALCFFCIPFRIHIFLLCQRFTHYSMTKLARQDHYFRHNTIEQEGYDKKITNDIFCPTTLHIHDL